MNQASSPGEFHTIFLLLWSIFLSLLTPEEMLTSDNVSKKISAFHINFNLPVKNSLRSLRSCAVLRSNSTTEGI
ncbi:hypothetical protein CPB83DRAFT_845880 [Crepidotus variabilis]|uniref:Secreted protein n=1 Tax=Crepidotus variabilis TaxID=179855 RepID=A0A9P6EQB8_9AGAR|nr:hypothetical protein CPB83DRAFT_845880 [Crepidotus variabilis]